MTPFQFGELRSADERRIQVPVKIESKQQLLTFLAKAFPLPAYFGHNWDALEECLSDLDWLPDRRAALVHADIPLKAPTERRTYLEILAKAAKGSPQLGVIFPAESRAEVEAVLLGSK